ncbi:MAG: biopolymer transporter ExbB [Lysobacterales bacterium]|jgi:biopolymer transport protein ExbB|nr:MAG: biopolymer transporter ExbB [Xanthomonadales bacterium]
MFARFLSIAFISAVMVVLAPVASGQQVRSLDELLRQTERAIQAERRINEQREREFREQRNRQRELLDRARAELRAEQERSDRLQREFDANERALQELETQLSERQGNLGEMFGVVRQVAADVKSQFENSMISAQIPGRTRFLSTIAQRKELPTLTELRRLWFEMQREITESGKSVSFTADIRDANGQLLRGQTVSRLGLFNAVANGKFLTWNPGDGPAEGLLSELRKQPSPRFTGTIAGFERAAPGSTVPLAVDFSRGAILSVVVDTPALSERLEQGGVVGYVTLALGALGLLIALIQGLRLYFEGAKIKRQLASEEPDPNNALGRVMAVYTENPTIDVETLELKMDEVILRETGRFEWGLQLIKVLYVVAPLLGLLGTVVGMIQTFQQITLFGTGDPKMMAGGISMALVTTVIGLTVAIPLTILHSILASKSKALVRTLEEQSAGLVALLAERRHGVRA